MILKKSMIESLFKKMFFSCDFMHNVEENRSKDCHWSNLIKLRTVIFLVKRMVIQDGYTMLIKLV